MDKKDTKNKDTRIGTRRYVLQSNGSVVVSLYDYIDPDTADLGWKKVSVHTGRDAELMVEYRDLKPNVPKEAYIP